MIYNRRIRGIFLNIQIIIILILLGKLIINPPLTDTNITPITKYPVYHFPVNIPLANWQLVKSELIKSELVNNSDYIDGHFIAGRRYQYQQNQMVLDIEMIYLMETNGDIKSFIKKYTQHLIPVLYQEKNMGYYAMFMYQERGYLDACINPRGGTTVTSDQFKINRYLYDLQLKRLWLWLTGTQNLTDNRCIWVHLSLPTYHFSAQKIYQILRQVWFDIYQYIKMPFEIEK